MTISSTSNRNDFTGNGTLAIFPYTYRIFSKTDLLVTQRVVATAVETTLAVDTDYTVAGVGDLTGGTITLLAGNLPTGTVMTVRRVRPLTQLTDIKNQGDFFPEVHEDTFDQLVMIAQQLDNENDRAFRLPETVSPTDVDTTLPVPESDKFIKWNTAADALENATLAAIGTLVIPAGLGFMVQSSSNVFSARTLVLTDGLSGTDLDGVSGSPTFGITASGVTTSKIDALAVTAGKLASNSVATVKIVDLNVTTEKLASGAATADKLASNSVATVKIVDLNVTTAKLASGAVTADKIASGAVNPSSVTVGLANQILFFDNSQTSHTVGTSVEKTIVSGTVPANTLGVNGALRFRAIAEDAGVANVGTTITYRLKLGGTTIATVTGVDAGTTSPQFHVIEGLLANLGLTNKQYSSLSVQNSNNKQGGVDSGPVAAIDTTVDQPLILTMTPIGDAVIVDMEYAQVTVAKP